MKIFMKFSNERASPAIINFGATMYLANPLNELYFKQVLNVSSGNSGSNSWAVLTTMIKLLDQKHSYRKWGFEHHVVSDPTAIFGLPTIVLWSLSMICLRRQNRSSMKSLVDISRDLREGLLALSVSERFESFVSTTFGENLYSFARDAVICFIFFIFLHSVIFHREILLPLFILFSYDPV